MRGAVLAHSPRADCHCMEAAAAWVAGEPTLLPLLLGLLPRLLAARVPAALLQIAAGLGGMRRWRT